MMRIVCCRRPSGTGNLPRNEVSLLTVAQLKERLGLTAFVLSEPEREVTSGYAGDLLSWVMGRAQGDGAWLTIMSNANVCAVAVLSDVACVVLTEDVRPDPELLQRAEAQGVNLLGTALSTFDAAAALKVLL